MTCCCAAGCACTCAACSCAASMAALAALTVTTSMRMDDQNDEESTPSTDVCCRTNEPHDHGKDTSRNCYEKADSTDIGPVTPTDETRPYDAPEEQETPVALGEDAEADIAPETSNVEEEKKKPWYHFWR